MAIATGVILANASSDEATAGRHRLHAGGAAHHHPTADHHGGPRGDDRSVDLRHRATGRHRRRSGLPRATGAGVPANQAVCALETLYSRVSDNDLRRWGSRSSPTRHWLRSSRRPRTARSRRNRSTRFRAGHRRLTHGPIMGLTRDELVASACAATGLDDFDGDDWIEGLDRLLDSLRTEADLNELGETVAESQLTTALTNRLRVIDWHRSHPELADAEVPAPVIILGQPRTGTTILFDLLAQDPAFRVPLTWEVADPIPPPRTETYATDPRIAASEAASSMTEAIIPGFQAIHPSGALRGQECVAITNSDFRSMLWSTVFRVPSYNRWLLYEADLTSAYRYHRQFLQVLQSEHPAPDGWLREDPGAPVAPGRDVARRIPMRRSSCIGIRWSCWPPPRR
ncbi:MAG: sulfotransferase [Acidimicrobiales bacterium]